MINTDLQKTLNQMLGLLRWKDHWLRQMDATLEQLSKHSDPVVRELAAKARIVPPQPR